MANKSKKKTGTKKGAAKKGVAKKGAKKVKSTIKKATPKKSIIKKATPKKVAKEIEWLAQERMREKELQKEIDAESENEGKSDVESEVEVEKNDGKNLIVPQQLKHMDTELYSLVVTHLCDAKYKKSLRLSTFGMKVCQWFKDKEIAVGTIEDFVNVPRWLDGSESDDFDKMVSAMVQHGVKVTGANKKKLFFLYEEAKQLNAEVEEAESSQNPNKRVRFSDDVDNADGSDSDSEGEPRAKRSKSQVKRNKPIPAKTFENNKLS
jgi:hypothetical protein